MGRLTVERRVDVAAPGQQQAVGALEGVEHARGASANLDGALRRRVESTRGSRLSDGTAQLR